MTEAGEKTGQISERLIAEINPVLPDTIEVAETALKEGVDLHEVLSDLVVTAYFCGYRDNVKNTKAMKADSNAEAQRYEEAKIVVSKYEVTNRISSNKRR